MLINTPLNTILMKLSILKINCLSRNIIDFSKCFCIDMLFKNKKTFLNTDILSMIIGYNL